MMRETVASAVRAAFEAKDPEAIGPLLAHDIELRPPTYGKSWHGKALVGRLLGIAAHSFDSLVYTDIIHSDDAIVMRFEATVGEKALSGVDMLRLDKEGRIAVFEIFSRPPRVALAFLERMTDRIAAEPELAAMMKGDAAPA